MYCIIFNPSIKAQQHVEDQVGILSSSEIAYLNELLKTYTEETTTEIAIRVVDSLGLSEKSIKVYAHEKFEVLSLGQKGIDNGILIYHSPKNHQVDIVLGYGIEPFISSLDIKKIINEEILPKFQDDKFEKGFSGAFFRIKKLLQSAIFISPQRDTFVLDQAKLLQDFEKEKLERKLKAYYDQTGNPIWLRIIEDEQSHSQARKIAKNIYAQLYDRKDEHYQTLYYIGVSKEEGKICTYPRVEHNWLSLAYEIESSYDHLASEYRNLGDASSDIVTFRLEEIVTDDLFALHKFHQGADLVTDFIQKIHCREIKASNDIKGPFSLRSFFSDPLFFTLLMFGIPIIAFFFFARGSGFSGYSREGVSSSSSSYTGGGNWNIGGDGGGFGGSPGSDNGGFGGGSSGGVGTNGEY